MPYLRSKLEHHSVPAIIKSGSTCRMNSLTDVYDWAERNHMDAVFNCTGLGAAILCNDPLLIPVRGHLVRVAAPWLKFGIYGPNVTHVYVGRDSAIIGGVRQQLPSTLMQPIQPDQVANSHEDTLDILKRMRKLWAAPLCDSDILEEWTGFRPHRDILRLELEWLQPKETGRKIPLIHNYGHGSMGITLSWGTALDAIFLMREALKASASSTTQNLLAPGLEKIQLK